MKRNFILLACNAFIIIILLILSAIYINTNNGGLASIDISNNSINKGFEKYFETKIRVENKHITTKTMLDKNIDDGKKDGKTKNSNYFNQNVFKHVDKILTDLQIQSESPRLPQDGELIAMDGFDYIEFEIDLVDCSFEKFGKFVNRLEKSDKIFVIDRFEFENSVERGVQRALQNDGNFPGKNISMKIWAVNLNKSIAGAKNKDSKGPK